MRTAARTFASGPLRAALAIALTLAALPSAAQTPAAPPARPEVGLAPAPSDPPPASAYASAVPEAARVRDAGDGRGGAWPAPPPRRPGAAAQPEAASPPPPVDVPLAATEPQASPAPDAPAPPPARGLPADLRSTLEAAVAEAPDGPQTEAPAELQAAPAAPPVAPAEATPAPGPVPDMGTALAAAVSPLPAARPQAPAVSRERAVASLLPDPRSGVRPPRGAVSRPQGEPSESGAPAAAAGGLCGDPRLAGRPQAPIDGPGRCGIEAPVEVTHVLGVALTPPAVVNCRTARTFAGWLERGPMRDAKPMLGARIAKVRVAASYACRSRNSRPGARLSEHALGNAVDVRAFQLTDGREIAPLRGWDKGDAGRFLKAAWSSACGPFGTVLGPESDEYHRDHLHFDTARRSEAWCR
ncbi:extensin family protein [Albimonas sp. CAU 1670]|uniref:extensin-like domain-containing protein n=1 Tax=Albimonas sp. CAU 1670 TaxID=3032599 RepID=UPI0023DC62E2|nr:extensin family protein [Albimonas sp. CAU 1670]MDF2235179.1 extensin family protein [Albimonas sp. CAU 1670]